MAGLYPTIEDIFNRTRVEVNDAFAGATSTQGEGRIFVDTWSPVITHLNQAIDHFKRDLEDSNVPVNREEYFQASIPPINGPNGSGVPDPSVQVYLGFNGYWDGSTVDASIVLPSDLIVPLEIWARSSGSGLTYGKISPAADGLPSNYQDYTLGQYEWRQDRIYFNGSTITMDIRVRYEAGLTPIATTLSPSLFPTTTVGFLDSAEPLSLYCAFIFCSNKTALLPNGLSGANDLLMRYNEATAKICNRYTKMFQRTTYDRAPYGEDGDLFGWFS